MEMCDQRHAPTALPPTKGPAAHFTGGWVGLGAGYNGYSNSRLTGFQPIRRVALPNELSRPVKVGIRNRYLPNKSQTDYYLIRLAQHA